jgi:heme-degrading monooxygenase HmoA
MYARLVLFTLGPGTRSTGEKLADQFAPALRAQKGFKSVTFFLDDIVGEYGALSLWESKEDADAASAALDPQLQQALTGIVQGPPTLQFFEVYESKA